MPKGDTKTVVVRKTPGHVVDAILGMRNRHFMALDVLAMLVIPALALSLRLDRFDWWADMGPALVFYTMVALLVKETTFLLMGIYSRYWRHAGLSDLHLLQTAVGLSAAILFILFITIHPGLAPWHLAMYRSVPLIDGLLTLVCVVGFRFGLRGLSHWYRQHRGVAGGRRVLLVGAGEAGTLVARQLRTNPALGMEPVAFVDDDDAKQHSRIEGLPVVGTCKQIPELVDRYGIQRIIVNMPSAPFSRLQEIIATCKKTGIVTHNLPGIYELLAGYKQVSRVPTVDISRLLHREPVQLNEEGISACLSGARVLVTGAGGSIGGELCRQIARFNPAELILLGHGENSIFEIHLDLTLSFPDLVKHPVIADVRDGDRMDWVVEKYQPDVIFHAAAHKHVPLMEMSAHEAITNNVLGTLSVLQAAERHGVGHFVLISTDKAVNPTSVMGATKRLAELLVVASAQRSGRPYIAVRFGNVLGSRGSVVPVFQQQIAAGGPVTVTHPTISRYFMTIPEAVKLVLEAGVLGKGGEVFVLDMGQPIRILEMAKDLIRLAGLEPGRDIQIAFIGLRPGEKLREELFLAQEDYHRTRHPRILCAACEPGVEGAMLERVVRELLDLTQCGQLQNGDDAIRALLPQVCRFLDGYQAWSPLALPETAASPEREARLVVDLAPA